MVIVDIKIVANFCLFVKMINQKSQPKADFFVKGWLTGFEPVMRLPQSPVLPLHYSHHKNMVPPRGISPRPIYPQAESNSHLHLRRVLLYPLSYGGRWRGANLHVQLMRPRRTRLGRGSPPAGGSYPLRRLQSEPRPYVGVESRCD